MASQYPLHHSHTLRKALAAGAALLHDVTEILHWEGGVASTVLRERKWKLQADWELG